MIKDRLYFVKRMMLAFMACAFLLSGAHAKSSDDILGEWLAYDELDGKYVAKIEFKKNKKKNTYYARVLEQTTTHSDYRTTCANCPDSFKGKPIKGIVILWDVKASKKNPHHYSEGYGLDPWKGLYFKGSAKLYGDVLRLRGSLLDADWISRHFIWKRAKK